MKRTTIRFNGVSLDIEYILLNDKQTPVITKISIKNEDITELVGLDNKQRITTYLKNKLSSLA